MTSHPSGRRHAWAALLIAACSPVVAAWPTREKVSDASSVKIVAGVGPERSGGGRLETPRDEITEEQREQIRIEIRDSIDRLRSAGRLAQTAVAARPLFGWPLRLASGLDDPGYHGISNFTDHDPRYPGFLLDYNCGERSYDLAEGYNHKGTDFFTWPWGWLKMDRGDVEVVAAADGQIVHRQDGFYDRNCGFGGSQWNAVYVRHADGSVAWYGHLKRGSVTAKPVGAAILRGEYLGVVGSSGNSTGPHLHLEIYDSNGLLADPYAGACNPWSPTSWWQEQRPYFDSAINLLTTGSAPPEFPPCPEDEIPHTRATFLPGSTIYFTTYYRDQLDGQTSVYTIRRPDGSIFSQWSDSISAQHYEASWWWWSLAVPADEMQGRWVFAVEFLGNSYERPFTVGSLPRAVPLLRPKLRAGG